MKVNKPSTTHHNINQNILCIGKGLRILFPIHYRRQFQLLENFVLIGCSKTGNPKQTNNNNKNNQSKI